MSHPEHQTMTKTASIVFLITNYIRLVGEPDSRTWRWKMKKNFVRRYVGVQSNESNKTQSLRCFTHMWTHAFAPNFSPSITGNAWCMKRLSDVIGSELYTLGQRTARPFFGITVISRLGKSVPPPALTSERYRKNVKILGPHCLSFWWGI